MSGPFGSPQWMYSSGSFYPHEIDNSVRFDSNSQLTRTPSSASNRRTYTWSAWFKRSKLSDAAYDGLFSAGTGVGYSSDRDVMYFDNADHLHFNGYASSAYTFQYKTTQQFRDPSAWYHIVLRVDTTYSDSSSADRVRIYINGEQITAYSTSTAPSYNHEGYVNNTVVHAIGSTPYNTTYFDGYIAEVNFIDGLSYGPTSFGETKADTWVPKEYEGSYGSLGYYLKFGNSSSLGTDSSGNGNTWTVTNIVATDQVPDSPTNNFATINPNIARWAVNTTTLTEGNLKGYSTGTSDYQFATMQQKKCYFEMLCTDNNTYPHICIQEEDLQSGSGSYGVFYQANGQSRIGGVDTTIAGFTSGDIVAVAFDYDGGEGRIYKNGTLLRTQTGQNFGSYLETYLAGGVLGANDGAIWNFGQDSSFAGQKTAQGNTDSNGIGDFYYQPPAGFLALCTANLPDPVAAINPAVDNSPQDHFNTVLYSGNDSTNNITGVGFQPDWVWLKARSSGKSWRSFDAVRGATKDLSINHESAEYTDSVSLTSFDSDGFTLGDDDGGCNGSGITYASWNWKANGAGSSNSDGTISATVSVNTDIGLSIVKYNGSSAGTVGHGLSSAPHIVIQKSLSTGSTYWWTGTTVIDGSLDFVRLNDVTVKADSSYSAPTSSVFSNVTFTGSTSNIAYCLHSVEGFSKVGIYTGNGSADGPFINCGFKPAFILIKNINTTDYWTLIDNKRVGYNETNSIVSTNYLSAEYAASGGGFDIVSSGFKVRGTSTNFNGNTNTMVYIAFAEMPFKYANAR